MRSDMWRISVLLAAAIGTGNGVIAQQAGSTPVEARTTNGTASTRLMEIAGRFRSFLKQEHLQGAVHSEDDVLVVEFDTRHEKLHMSGKTGKEEAFLRDMMVPNSHGWRAEVQIQPGEFVGQAVRPWTSRVTYHNRAGKPVSWTRYLGQSRFKTDKKTVLLNLDYGNQVNPGQINRLKTIVQSQ